jgi:hypothetical protein
LTSIGIGRANLPATDTFYFLLSHVESLCKFINAQIEHSMAFQSAIEKFKAKS